MMAPASQELQKELQMLDKKAQLLAANKKAAQAILLAISLQLGTAVVSTSTTNKENGND